MKKILALVLSLAMALTLLSGCGGSGGSTPAKSDAGGTSSAASGGGDAAPSGSFDPMTITVSCSTNENETPSKVLQKFIDEVQAATGNAVEFKVYWGSTFCNSTEELYQLQSGSLDMCILQTLAYGDVLPLMVSVPQMWRGTDEDAKNYFDELFCEGETGELIANSLAQFNTHMIGNIYTGLNCYFSTKEFNSFADLKGLKVGCQDSAPIDGLGLTAVFVDVGDYYDSLERGVIDAGTFSFDGTVALKLYEPANHVMLDQGKTWGMPFCMRADLWDSMSPELQKVFSDAMSAAQDYSVELVNANIEAAKNDLSSEGVVLGTLSDEDAAASFQAQLKASIASGMARSKAAGCDADMLVMLNKSLELYDLSADEYLADYQ